MLYPKYLPRLMAVVSLTKICYCLFLQKEQLHEIYNTLLHTCIVYMINRHQHQSNINSIDILISSIVKQNVTTKNYYKTNYFDYHLISAKNMLFIFNDLKS